MGIVIDLSIIAIVALSTFLAYRKGLIGLAVSLCTFIITIVATFVLYQPITNLVVNCTGIDEAVEDAIYERVNNKMNQNAEQMEEVNKLIETAKNEMLPEAVRNLAINIVRGGVIIVLFITIKIALKFVKAIANFVSKLPIIDQLNKTGGIIYGLLRGILMVYIAFLIISVGVQLSPNNTIEQTVNNSTLGKIMYQNNILSIWFK